MQALNEFISIKYKIIKFCTTIPKKLDLYYQEELSQCEVQFKKKKLIKYLESSRASPHHRSEVSFCLYLRALENAVIWNSNQKIERSLRADLDTTFGRYKILCRNCPSR